MRDNENELQDKVQGTNSGVAFNAMVSKFVKTKKVKNTVKTPVVKK